MKRLLSALLLLSLTALAGEKAAAPAAPDTDPVFQALDDELARARDLRMENLEKPYYLQAFATEEERFGVQASFGALVSRGGDQHRNVSVEVRVGSPAFDNTNFGGEFGNHAGAPAEADYDALRHALWLRFDQAYKSAAETYAKKRAYLEAHNVPDRPPDFAPGPTVTMVLPKVKMTLDKDRWTQVVKKASAVFRAHPQIYSGDVALQTSFTHQYFVSTDPARHRFGETWVHLSIRAATQAPDGMELHTGYQLWGRKESDLPKDDEVIKVAQAVANRLEALVKAPVVSEDYTGPVLFTGRAAATFFLQTVGEPLSRPRDDLGSSREGRLVDRLGKHVASALLTVRDDPTQAEWHGRALAGAYPVDDDGVKPQAITLIQAGVLKTYYMSRVPTKRVTQTNGHSRAGVGAVGNLFVEGTAPRSRDALKKQLVALAKEEDQDFGLLIDDLEDGEGNPTNVSLPSPLVMYRVYADGREELVRGGSFKPASYRILKEIVAVGNDTAAVNTLHHGQHVAVIAPSVLVKNLELRKTREEQEKPPFTARPELDR